MLPLLMSDGPGQLHGAMAEDMRDAITSREVRNTLGTLKALVTCMWLGVALRLLLGDLLLSTLSDSMTALVGTYVVQGMAITSQRGVTGVACLFPFMFMCLCNGMLGICRSAELFFVVYRSTCQGSHTTSPLNSTSVSENATVIPADGSGPLSKDDTAKLCHILIWIQLIIFVISAVQLTSALVCCKVSAEIHAARSSQRYGALPADGRTSRPSMSRVTELATLAALQRMALDRERQRAMRLSESAAGHQLGGGFAASGGAGAGGRQLGGGAASGGGTRQSHVVTPESPWGRGRGFRLGGDDEAPAASAPLGGGGSGQPLLATQQVEEQLQQALRQSLEEHQTALAQQEHAAAADASPEGHQYAPVATQDGRHGEDVDAQGDGSFDGERREEQHAEAEAHRREPHDEPPPQTGPATDISEGSAAAGSRRWFGFGRRI